MSKIPIREIHLYATRYRAMCDAHERRAKYVYEQMAAELRAFWEELDEQPFDVDISESLKGDYYTVFDLYVNLLKKDKKAWAEHFYVGTTD